MSPETNVILQRMLNAAASQCEAAIARRESLLIPGKEHEIPSLKERLESYRKALREVRSLTGEGHE